jgi:uncharacterized repeat protein (TIGR03803 family)
MALPGQTVTTLYVFRDDHGAYPSAGLIQATNGMLYGTTEFGWRGGTVFEVSTEGALEILHDFCTGDDGGCADGGIVHAGLVQAPNGDFYGTTEIGGTAGNGTIFKISADGTATVLYSFCTQTGCPDGATPYGGLVQAANGDFYGTAAGGAGLGYGTVFVMTPSGTLETLYNLCSGGPPCTDGANPYATLIQGLNGSLYGTTTAGGAGNAGTVFKITSSGALTTLYSFCAQGPPCADGESPEAGLVEAANGNFYGTTSGGGANGGGTIFEFTPGGTLTPLYSFCAQNGCADGQLPVAPLIQATDGNLYGTTQEGGAFAGGTIFEITSGGTFTSLYSFNEETIGSSPEAPLLQATDGNFYSTTYYGGPPPCIDGCGIIYELSMGLGPFVETQPASGAAGAAVTILGTDLTGATSVTFNGTPAVFTVVRASEITTAVPAGASTGTVQVATPGGTLLSNVAFRVR